jgi:hypothetical protein
VPIAFSFHDLDDDLVLGVDSHSSSPAFSEEAKSLVFNLVKMGAMSPADAVEHLDAPNPEELVAGIERRQQAAAQQEQQQAALSLVKGGKK